MSATPRTDAVKIGPDHPHKYWEDFARELERELARAAERLTPWETGFDTTNAAQAVAEHAAVLAKRDALMRENAELLAENRRLLDDNKRLTEGSQSIKKSQESLRAELAAERQKIEDLKRAPEKPQASAQ